MIFTVLRLQARTTTATGARKQTQEFIHAKQAHSQLDYMPDPQ